MKNILLINPHETGMGERSSPPLGLLYLAGVLQLNNIPVNILDGFVLGWQGLQKELEQYKLDVVGIVCHTYARAKALKIAKIVKQICSDALVVSGTRLYKHAQNMGVIDDDFWLSDYNWKIYTYENSKLRLNILPRNQYEEETIKV